MMNDTNQDKINFFMRYLTEAPDDQIDEMPDFTPPSSGDTSTEDVGSSNIDEAPDIGGATFSDDDSNFDSFNSDSEDGDDTGEDNIGDEENNGGEEKPPHLSDKVSNIMNLSIYQKFTVLLNKIENQLSSIKNNQDIINQLYPDVAGYTQALRKLEENIQLYLNNQFMNENAGKNILFFNKCLNLLKLLNDKFDANISKGLKGIE